MRTEAFIVHYAAAQPTVTVLEGHERLSLARIAQIMAALSDSHGALIQDDHVSSKQPAQHLEGPLRVLAESKTAQFASRDATQPKASASCHDVQCLSMPTVLAWLCEASAERNDHKRKQYFVANVFVPDIRRCPVLDDRLPRFGELELAPS